ncbi:unnamed protein product, partial [Rotaria magnacalcarata]
MTRDEREALSQRICNFYIDSSNNSVKTTIGRSYKISHEQLDGLVKSVNNRCGLSQRKLGRRFWGLFPFIEKYHHNGNYLFWPDLASAHYSNIVKERLHEKNVPLVARQDNPPNVPQARSIETVWALLERK